MNQAPKELRTEHNSQDEIRTRMTRGRYILHTDYRLLHTTVDLYTIIWQAGPSRNVCAVLYRDSDCHTKGMHVPFDFGHGMCRNQSPTLDLDAAPPWPHPASRAACSASTSALSPSFLSSCSQVLAAHSSQRSVSSHSPCLALASSAWLE